MRRSIVVVALLVALPVVAQDAYRFRFRVTDGRTGLLANPHFADLEMSDEQLARAANDRVMVFDQATGARWNWLMLSWPSTSVEQSINARGGASRDADFGLTPNENGTVKFRCRRAECALRITTPDRSSSTFQLKNDESRDLPTDAEFDLTFR